MTMRAKANIGRAEMEIFHYVADHHPVTVRQVADHVAETKGHVRTTVLNVMERLRRKKYLTRQRVDGVFQYSPSQPKAALLQTLVRDFVEKTLGGSLSPFVTYLVEQAKVSDEEFRRLRQLVRELERKQKEAR
jgi:predicted transcriptional regulator